MPTTGQPSSKIDYPALKQDLQRHHNSQLNICDRLEALADNLPDKADAQECLLLAQAIYPVVHDAHQFEENELFPALVECNATDSNLPGSIERLRYEHWEDEAYAEEISDYLRQFVSAQNNTNPEALAYMLRGFFEGMRRHIAFEVEHIAPMLKAA